MRDIAFAWLAKDAASHGMADYATEIGLVLTRGFGNVGIRRVAVKRNMSRNIESVDTLESQVVEKLYGAAISAAVLSRLARVLWDSRGERRREESGTHAPGRPANVLTRSDHQVVQFLRGIDHDAPGMLNLLVARRHGKV